MSIWRNLQDNPGRMQQILMGLGMMGSKTRPQFDRYLQGAELASQRIDRRNAEMQEKAEREAARQQFAGLLGSPGEVTAGPDSLTGPQGTAPSGFLGGRMPGMEFAAQAMQIPGYEGIGGGLLGKYIDQQGDAVSNLASMQNTQFKQDLEQRKFLKQLQDQVKPYTNRLMDMKGKFNAMMKSASVEAGDATGRGAADLAMVFAFAKMLDPASVVREGEQQMITRSDGLFGYLQGLVSNIQGEGSLSVDTRKGLLAQAYRELQGQSAPVVQQLSFLAEGMGDYAPQAINPEALGFMDWIENVQLPETYGAKKPELAPVSVGQPAPPPLDYDKSAFDPKNPETWPKPPFAQ